MLEGQSGGRWKKVLAAVSAFQLVTADPGPSLAAVPKELEQVVPKGGFKDFLDKGDKGSLEDTIKIIRGFQRRVDEAVSNIRSAVGRMKQLRKEFDEKIKDTLGGKSEETLSVDMQKKLQDARRSMDVKISEHEVKLRQTEEMAKEIQNTLDEAIRIFQRFDKLKQQRK